PAPIRRRSLPKAAVRSGSPDRWRSRIPRAAHSPPISTARSARSSPGSGGRSKRPARALTVFITDARLGDRFTQLRREIFADNFPASALITVAGLARPEMLVEVQGVAVAR